MEGAAPAARIAIVGDYDPSSANHGATYAGLQHAACALGLAPRIDWIATEAAARSDAALAGVDGVFVTTGSPYKSLAGACRAIELARTRAIPLLGTCGGFQHVVLEHARNVLGAPDAMHAEYDPDASRLFISRLACSLAGKTMAVRLEPASRAYDAYGGAHAEERYYCSFGVSPEHVADLERGGLRIGGRDPDGEPRIVERPEQPFFVATLFVPQARSMPERPHPLLLAYLRAVAVRARRAAG